MTKISEIKRIVSNRAAEYGAERIYLFGSYARGEETESSDVDLRIDKGRIKGLALAGLLNALEDDLGMKVDLVSTGCLDEEFLDLIKREEMLLYDAGTQ